VEEFRRDVVDPSRTALVVVDFWAEWCGPCKQLTPVIEKVCADYAAKGVKLVKINVDENRFIASQFRVQSIPTVYAVFQGQPVADLSQARTEGQLKQMLDQILAQLPVQSDEKTLEAEVEPLIAMAEQVLEDGDAERALSIFAQIADMAPEHPAVLAGQARALVALERLDEAQAVLDAAPADIAKDARIERARGAAAGAGCEAGGGSFGRGGACRRRSRRSCRPVRAGRRADGQWRSGWRGGRAAGDHRTRQGLERGSGAHATAPAVRGGGTGRPVGLRTAPSSFGHSVHLSERGNEAVTGQRISVFPLAGALLFPGSHLPLHIFEPRYRALVSDALARDRMIGMIQPCEEGARPKLYDVGCLGRITECEALEDGRFNIILAGLARFRIVRELDVTTPFRQVEAEVEDEGQDGGIEPLAPAMRAALELEARRFAEHLGYIIDWSAVSRLDDMTFVNSVAQVAPFDVAAKQALLETRSLIARAELAMQLMQFFGHAQTDRPATLQ
jgi:thioredoxin